MDDQRFRSHPKNRKKVVRADKKICTIAGRLVRELDRQLPVKSICRDKLALFTKVLQQKRSDKNKAYSLYKTDIVCIKKGREHKKYELGNKVSIVCSIRDLISESVRRSHD